MLSISCPDAALLPLPSWHKQAKCVIVEKLNVPSKLTTIPEHLAQLSFQPNLVTLVKHIDFGVLIIAHMLGSIVDQDFKHSRLQIDENWNRHYSILYSKFKPFCFGIDI